MSASTAARFGLTEVGCVVAVDIEDHVALGVGYDGVGVCWDVVEEMVGALHGVLGGRCLSRGKGA